MQMDFNADDVSMIFHRALLSAITGRVPLSSGCGTPPKFAPLVEFILYFAGLKFHKLHFSNLKALVKNFFNKFT